MEPLLSSVPDIDLDGIDWAIVGGESGPGARPMAKEWVEDIRAQYFADLNKAPYRAVFNPSVSGTKAFNATVMLRTIENWIDQKKKHYPKKRSWLGSACSRQSHTSFCGI